MTKFFQKMIVQIQGKLCKVLNPRGGQVLAGIWEDEHQLMLAAKKVREAGFESVEAITPFPVHGLDEALGLERSFIPWVTFIFGSMGCGFGLWFTWWVSAVSWPLNIGGKPAWSLPAFVPVIFELTILFAALGSVAALFVVIGLPKINPPIIDPDLTCHKFALFVSAKDKNFDSERLESLFKQMGASEVKVAEF